MKKYGKKLGKNLKNNENWQEKVEKIEENGRKMAKNYGLNKKNR